ncbi:MAG: hypothetical protein KA116_04425 [Proteobacteria bacterium]|nr:hypothetical protein [Pseudomonadota bacterium]
MGILGRGFVFFIIGLQGINSYAGPNDFLKQLSGDLRYCGQQFVRVFQATKSPEQQRFMQLQNEVVALGGDWSVNPNRKEYPQVLLTSAIHKVFRGADFQDPKSKQAQALVARAMQAMKGDPKNEFIFKSFLRDAAYSTDAFQTPRIVQSIFSVESRGIDSSLKLLDFWGRSNDPSLLDNKTLVSQIKNWWKKKLANGKTPHEQKLAENLLMTSHDAGLEMHLVNPSSRLSLIITNFVTQSKRADISSVPQRFNVSNVNRATEFVGVHLKAGGDSSKAVLDQVIAKSLEIAPPGAPLSYVPDTIRSQAQQQMLNRLSGGGVAQYNLRNPASPLKPANIDPEKGVMSMIVDKAISDPSFTIENGVPFLKAADASVSTRLIQNVLRPLKSVNGEGFWVMKPRDGFPNQTEFRFFDNEDAARKFCVVARNKPSGNVIPINGQYWSLLPLK